MIEQKSTSSMAVGFQRFKECFDAVLLKEEIRIVVGGGRTRTTHRISQAVYSIWREDHFHPDNDVRGITPEEIEALYMECFWIPSHAQECPRPVDLLVFDASIQWGAKRAVKMLQQALGVPCDGILGPLSREALLRCDGITVARRLQQLDSEGARPKPSARIPRNAVETRQSAHRMKAAA
jgi:hypothetical protein